MDKLFYAVPEKQTGLTRAEVEQHTAEFLARGGKISKAQVGFCAESAKPSQPLAISGVDPAGVKARATESSNVKKMAPNAANKALARNERLNQQHTAIIAAAHDLQQRGVKASANELKKATGQPLDALNRRLDALIVRGYIVEGTRCYSATDKGLDYIGVHHAANQS